VIRGGDSGIVAGPASAEAVVALGCQRKDRRGRDRSDQALPAMILHPLTLSSVRSSI